MIFCYAEMLPAIKLTAKQNWYFYQYGTASFAVERKSVIM